jgi:hypothetical protein
LGLRRQRAEGVRSAVRKRREDLKEKREYEMRLTGEANRFVGIISRKDYKDTHSARVPKNRNEELMQNRKVMLAAGEAARVHNERGRHDREGMGARKIEIEV